MSVFRLFLIAVALICGLGAALHIFIVDESDFDPAGLAICLVAFVLAIIGLVII